MRVLMISKACVVGAYRHKLQEIGTRGVDLTVVVPPEWRDPSGTRRLEMANGAGYRLLVTPMRLNGHFHLHYYPELPHILERLRPDILHVDEEPWDLVSYHAVRHALRTGARPLFFTWQNLLRRYPWPFSHFQRFTFEHCAHAIAGNADAVSVLRRKGYRGRVCVVPQFGVDTEVFRPLPNAPPLGENQNSHDLTGRPFVIGYAGRFTKEKGVDTLLRALAGLDGDWRLRLAGSGAELANLRRLARQLHIAEHVEFVTELPSMQMADFYRSLDALVVPSRRARNWVEQFGRVLVEAMACGVPVIGSDSGEIPNTIGDAGLIFPTDDDQRLREQLRRLMGDAALRRELAQRGRARVLSQYTQAHVAEQTVAVYRKMLG